MLSSVASRFPCFDDAKVLLFAYTHKFCNLFFRIFAPFLMYVNMIVCVHTPANVSNGIITAILHEALQATPEAEKSAAASHC